MAWNITFGLVLMATTFGWSTTREMVRESRKKKGEKRSLSDLKELDAAAEPADDGSDTRSQQVSPGLPVSPPPAATFRCISGTRSRRTS